MGLNLMTGVLLRRGKFGQRHRREYCMNIHRNRENPFVAEMRVMDLQLRNT